MTNKNGSHWIRPEKRLAIYLRDSFTCAYCLKDLRYVLPKFRTLDHVLPREFGGSHNANNLVTCCKKCNDRKAHRGLREFCKSFGTLKALNIEERVEMWLTHHIDIAAAKRILNGEIDEYSEVTE